MDYIDLARDEEGFDHYLLLAPKRRRRCSTLVENDQVHSQIWMGACDLHPPTVATHRLSIPAWKVRLQTE